MIYSYQKTGKKESVSKKKKISLVFLLVVMFLIFLLSGLSFLSKWSKFSIKEVKISGSEIIGEVDILASVDENLSGKYFKLFSKKNILIYPKDEIISDLKSKFKILYNVDVYPLNYNSIQIDLSLREPDSLWCDGIPSDSLLSRCYFLDKEGLVFAKAPYFSGDAYFKYYGLLPFDAPIGSYFLSSPVYFKNLSKFVLSVKKLNITPLYIVASTTNSFEMELFSGGKIFFNLNEDLDKNLNKLESFLNSKDRLENSSTTDIFQYIDLRFGNKVFYKLKE